MEDSKIIIVMPAYNAEKTIKNTYYEIPPKFRKNIILVDDKKSMSSKEALENLDGLELFIKSPGIAYNELVREVQSRKIELIDEIELAYRYSKGKFRIIAVTGTNGKTTTVNLAMQISTILKHPAASILTWSKLKQLRPKN